MPIRVLVADDEALVREALIESLDSRGIEVVGEAADAEEAVDRAGAVRPHVALLDVRMPRGGGTKAARGITIESPGTRALALSAYPDKDSVTAMLDAGTVGYVVKGAATREIGQAVYRAARGQAAFSVDVAPHIVAGIGPRPDVDRRAYCAGPLGPIRGLLETGQPHMVFQPIMDLASGGLFGVEALARFSAKPERVPTFWLAEADSVGLRIDLELAAISAALASLQRLHSGVCLSLNMSPETIGSRRLREVLSVAPADRLVLELSEQAPVSSYRSLAGSLAPLRDAGVRLAIDDAGTSLGSLEHVIRLRPDFVKLDLTVIRGIDVDPTAQALASHLTASIVKRDGAVIAEGIETAEEVSALRSIGVRYGQGRFLARPGPMGMVGPRDTRKRPSRAIRRRPTNRRRAAS